ncbi:MAG: efflux RND transporter periplasmic adaptor subunit [Muribaculaceae bacterium]
MKTVFKTIFTCASLIMFMACSGGANNGHDHENESAHELEHGHEHEHEHDGEHEDEHGENSESNEITFSPAKAKQFGVTVMTVKPGVFHETVKVSGQIIGAQGDEFTAVATSAGVVRLRQNIAVGSQVAAGSLIASVSAKNIVGGDSNQQALIILNNAKRELDRLKPLYDDKIVTAREYNAALENYERAKAACTSKSSTGGSATTSIAGTITEIYVNDGEYVDAGAPIAKISRNSRLVLRADLPTSYARMASGFASANFRTANTDSTMSISQFQGRRISGNSLTATQPGYIPVCFELTNNGSLVVGSFAEVYLIGNERNNVISVPVKSLTEELGSFYVYAQLDEECYEKRAVTTGINDGVNVEITSGLKSGDKVVVNGAMVIKLAGNSGAIPGHTHEH